MKTFTDNAGRLWTISINVTAVKRCRALVNVDLYGLVGEKFAPLEKLLSDPVQFVDVIFCLCKDEAEKRSITDEEFGRGMAGDAIENAIDAFLSELTDFFPDARVRKGLEKVLTLNRQVKDQVIATMLDRLDEIDPESAVKRFIDSSGTSLESSESTPARLRSVS